MWVPGWESATRRLMRTGESAMLATAGSASLPARRRLSVCLPASCNTCRDRSGRYVVLQIYPVPPSVFEEVVDVRSATCRKLKGGDVESIPLYCRYLTYPAAHSISLSCRTAFLRLDRTRWALMPSIPAASMTERPASSNVIAWRLGGDSPSRAPRSRR